MEAIQALPPEILREKAYIAFINCATMTEAAAKAGVQLTTMRNWINQYNWEEDKKQHYQKVHERVQFHLARLVEIKAELATAIVDKIMRMLDTDLDEAELGTKKEVAESMKLMAETMAQIMGTDEPKHKGVSSSLDININLDAESAGVYEQVIDVFNKDNDGDWDLEEEITKSSITSEE